MFLPPIISGSDGKLKKPTVFNRKGKDNLKKQNRSCADRLVHNYALYLIYHTYTITVINCTVHKPIYKPKCPAGFSRLKIR